METQRNKTQVKEQRNSPEEELDEMEASNLSHREFRVMIIRILNGIKKKQKKNIEVIKNDQSEINNTISEIKSALEGKNSVLDETEDQISDLENKVEKTPRQSSKKKN